MEEYREYDTVMIRLSSGRDQEFAIMDEFDFEEKHYIAVSAVVKEEIQEGLYLYRAESADAAPDTAASSSDVSANELLISRIEDPDEFSRVSAYYEAL